MGLLCVCLSVCLSVRHVVVLYLNIAIVGPSANKFGTVNLVGVDVVLAGLKFRSNWRSGAPALEAFGTPYVSLDDRFNAYRFGSVLQVTGTCWDKISQSDQTREGETFTRSTPPRPIGATLRDLKFADHAYCSTKSDQIRYGNPFRKKHVLKVDHASVTRGGGIPAPQNFWTLTYTHTVWPEQPNFAWWSK